MKISVCMAVFNGQEYLQKQIESILIQLDDFGELLILDDCSTDNSWELLNSIYGNDVRVKLFRNEYNIGVIKSFEKIISKADNEIIFLSDQDDIWMPGRVSEVIHFFEDDEKIIGVLVNALICDSSDNLTGAHFFSKNKKERMSIFHQFVKNDFIGCCLCFRRSAVKMITPFPSNISMHDWWIGSTLLSVGKVLYFEKPLIMYRRHGMNLSPSTRRGWVKVMNSRIFNLFALFELFFRKLIR